MRRVIPALRYFLVVSTVLILLLTAAAVSLSLGVSRPLYEWIASSALNRDVQIEGPVALRLGTMTTITVNGVTIAGITEATPVFAKVGSAVAQLSLLPLLDNDITLSAASMTDVAVFIDIDENDQGNWPAPGSETLEADRVDGSEEILYGLRATDVHMERVQLSVQDTANSRQHAVFIDALHETLIDDHFQVISRGTLNNTPFETTMTLDGVVSLLDIRDWEAGWQGTLGDADFQLSTSIESLDQIMRSEINVAIHADSANALLQTFALPAIKDGPVDMALHTHQHDSRQLIDIDVQFGEFHIAGTADQDLAALWESGHVALRASGPSLSEFGALWGTPNWPTTPFNIDLEGSVEGSEINVETLQLNSDAVTLALSGKLPGYRSLGTGSLSGMIDIPTLSAFSSLLDLPRQLQGSLHGTVLLTRDAGVTDVLLASQSSLLTLELSGRLTPGEGFSGSTMHFSGSSAEPSQWLGLVTDSPPTLGPVQFSGAATVMAPETVALEKLVVRMGKDVLAAEGILGWATAQHKTAISMAVQSHNLRTTLTPWVQSPQFIPSVPAKAESDFTYPSADLVDIENAVMSAATGVVRFVGAASLKESTPTLSGFMDISVPDLQPLFTQFTVPQRYQRPLNLKANIALAPGTIAISVDNDQLTYGSISATGHLSIDLIDNLAHFNWLASAPDLMSYLPAGKNGIDRPPMPMNMNVIGEWNEVSLRVQSLSVESREIQIDAGGFLELASLEFISSHLDADININRLSELNDWLDFPLPDQDLQVTADFDSRGGALVIDTLALHSGDSDLIVQGTIERPSDLQVALDIVGTRLNLDPWVDALRKRNDTKSKRDHRATDNRYILPDYPISTEWLSHFSANVDLQIDELVGMPRPVFNVQGAFTMGNSGIRIERLSAENERSGGATLTGSLLSRPETAPQFDIAIEGSELVLGIPKAPSEEIDSLPSYEFRSKFSGEGTTTRKLASNLDGYLNVVMGSGKVLNAGFDRLTNSFLQELSKTLNPLQNQQEDTSINCAAAFVAVENGKLSGKPAIVVDTPNVKIFSDVTLDLESEHIKAKFKTVPQKGLGFSVSSVFNPYVEVSGTLATPKITVDPANTLVGGSLAVMTGGLSILAKNFVDRVNASGNVCAERLIEANEQMQKRDIKN
ncbi:AsmA family protein [Luminiphilus sp.]|nr:AsmA family protein [Luminiphilus sp.]